VTSEEEIRIAKIRDHVLKTIRSSVTELKSAFGRVYTRAMVERTVQITLLSLIARDVIRNFQINEVSFDQVPLLSEVNNLLSGVKPGDPYITADFSDDNSVSDTTHCAGTIIFIDGKERNKGVVLNSKKTDEFVTKISLTVAPTFPIDFIELKIEI